MLTCAIEMLTVTSHEQLEGCMVVTFPATMIEGKGAVMILNILKNRLLLWEAIVHKCF